MQKLQKMIDSETVSSLNLYILDNDDPRHDCRPFALIENVRTKREYENRGYATELLEEAIQRATQAGCYKVILETSSRKPNVAHLYEKLGFRSGYKIAYHLGLEGQ